MFDRVTTEQQQKKKQKAMALARESSPVSEELICTEQWIQYTRGGVTMPKISGPIHSSVTTALSFRGSQSTKGCRKAQESATTAIVYAR